MLKTPQLRIVTSEELNGLSSGRIGHSVIGLIAISEAVFECSNQFGLRLLGLLNLRSGVLVSEHAGTERVLGVGDVFQDLAVAANLLSGLKL